MLSPELRSGLYAILSDLFAFPDGVAAVPLDQENLEEAAFLLGAEAPPGQGIKALAELQTAYTGLFINRPGGVPAPPYGAVYLESEPRLMGESTRAVLAAYREAGVSPEDSSEPPDSLWLELEFMAHLAEEEARALEDSDGEAAEGYARRQAAFCREFLHPWVFEFCGRLDGDETAHPLYRWGARLLERFSRLERERFAGSPA